MKILVLNSTHNADQVNECIKYCKANIPSNNWQLEYSYNLSYKFHLKNDEDATIMLLKFDMLKVQHLV